MYKSKQTVNFRTVSLYFLGIGDILKIWALKGSLPCLFDPPFFLDLTESIKAASIWKFAKKYKKTTLLYNYTVLWEPTDLKYPDDPHDPEELSDPPDLGELPHAPLCWGQPDTHIIPAVINWLIDLSVCRN